MRWLSDLPTYQPFVSGGDDGRRARALLLAQSVCDGVPAEVLGRVVDGLMAGALPRTYGQMLIAGELSREGLLPVL
jgi:hypothetical protein